MTRDWAPRVPEHSVQPRLLGVSPRPLNFPVRSQEDTS